MNRYAHIATCCAIFAIAISGGLSADTTQNSYQLPSDAQVMGYLLQSVTWYRHLYTERQVASDPGDRFWHIRKHACTFLCRTAPGKTPNPFV